MKITKVDAGSEWRQLEFVQRVGRIGYWEYDPASQKMVLADAAQDWLSQALNFNLSVQHSFLDVLHDTERRRLQSALDQTLREHQPFTLELALTDRAGAVASLVVQGEPIELSPGVPGMAGILRDVSAQKQRDAEHERLVLQLQALLDVLPQGVSVVDKDLNLMVWNRRFLEILDFPQDLVFKGADFESFIRFNVARGDYGPGDPTQQVQTIVARAREFLPHRFERQLPNGRTLLIEGLPFKSGGEVSGFVTTYTDITDQRHTEELLTRQRDEMKTVIDNFPGGISLCNSDLRFTTYNAGMMELLDFPPALFAKGWVDFEDLVRYNVARGEYGPGDPEQQVHISLERARNFQAHQFERARPNGRWLEIRGTPIPSGGFVSIYIDITARKRMEAELVQSKEVAEARRAQVASLLDHSGQGFLSFGADLVVEAECSRACATLLGVVPAGLDAAQVLFDGDVTHADLLRETVPAALAESDLGQCETMLSLLPAEFQRGDLLLRAEYKLLENQRVMVVLTNATAERQLEIKVQSERRRLEMIVAAVTDSRDFFDTLDSFGDFLSASLPSLLAATLAPELVVRELYRQVHTFKGLLNQFSFSKVPMALHALESRLEGLRQIGSALTRQQITEVAQAVPLAVLFEADLDLLREALGADFLDHGDRIVISSDQAAQLQQLAEQLLHGAPVDATLATMRALLLQMSQLRKIPLKDALTGFDRLIQQTANRLEKEVDPLAVNGGQGVWIEPHCWQPFLRSLTHIFRNAVVHGIEDPDTRLALGKPEAGTIACTVEVRGTQLQLVIADDGAGIDFDALGERAVAAGVVAAADLARLTEAENLDFIFLDNISTQQVATELAGRGVGLAV
ncbi:MAG: PAS-domain containing protein, partial [Rhodoferax sp.]|nr:PAS-domain containing protein [Rhodoferax sp.]